MEELKEKISDLIEDEKMKDWTSIGSFFNLLFWKNYTEGYVDVKDKNSILTEIKNATINGDLDTEEILPFVNKIRKQIGLKELTTKLENGWLAEITDKVRKELIIKALEK